MTYGPPWWTDEQREQVKAAFASSEMCSHCCERVPILEIEQGMHDHPAVMD